MRIAPLRERLIFQVRKVVKDEIGNESSRWTDSVKRWCSCRLLALGEGEGAVTVTSIEKVRFTLRYDPYVLGLNSLTTRLVFRKHYYQILSIDGDSVPRDIIYIDAVKEVSDGR